MNDPLATAATALEGLLSSSEDNTKLEAARAILDSEFADRRLRLQESAAREETNGKEIDRLAQFILDEFPQAVGQATAVDTAISIIKNLRDQARNDSAD